MEMNALSASSLHLPLSSCLDFLLLFPDFVHFLASTTMSFPPTSQNARLLARVEELSRRPSTPLSTPGSPDHGNSGMPPLPQDSDTASSTGSVSGELDREGSTTSLKIDTTLPPSPVILSPLWSPSTASPVSPVPPPGWFHDLTATGDEPQSKSTRSHARVGDPFGQSSPPISSTLGFPNRGNSDTPPLPQDSDVTFITGSVFRKFDREGSTTSLKIDTKFPQSPVITVETPPWSPDEIQVEPPSGPPSEAPSPSGWVGGSLPQGGLLSPDRAAAPLPGWVGGCLPQSGLLSPDHAAAPLPGWFSSSQTSEVEQLRRDLVASTSQIIELQQRDEARLTELAAARGEIDQLRRELRELSSVRDELRIFQSQSTEIQQRYDEQLKEIRLAVLERQSQPLAMQRFFAVADTHANKIITRMLQQLNANAQLLAKNMAECIIEYFEPQATTMSEEQISTAQRISEYLGETLTGYLGRNERDSVALYLPIAFQAYLVCLLRRIMSSWTTEKRTNDVISEIYERLQKSGESCGSNGINFSAHGRNTETETQTIAGRWRSLTRTYMVPTHRNNPNHIVMAAVEGLSDIVVVAGCATSVAGARSTVSSKFEDRISFILATVGTFSKMIWETISADFKVFAVAPVEKFERAMMEEDTGQIMPRGTSMTQRVLSSTHLGLTKRIRLESGKEDISTVIKAKVVLEPFPDR